MGSVITFFQRRHGGARLFDCYSRLQSTNDTEDAAAAHHLFVGESRNDIRFGRPDFCVWTNPRKWKVRQNTNDRMCDAVECDAAANHVWIATHSLLPKILRHHRDVRALFFLWQKIAAANRSHAEDIEIIGSYAASEQVDRIAKSGQSKGR